MPDIQQLKSPWLIAVWPGMGHVALSAGYYLMSKLGMQVVAEYTADELFDIDHVEVKEGLIQPGQRPRSRFFVWIDPEKKHDIIVFIGESQPPLGKHVFCRRLMDYARQVGVERVMTFAAMGTQMHPEQPARVFGAATDAASLEQLKRLELEILQDGHIGGLNGVLLGVAAEVGIPGACLLGEMPHIFAQFPFPKASRAVLEAFTAIAGISLDFADLDQQVLEMNETLGQLVEQAQNAFGQQLLTEDQAAVEPVEEEQRVNPVDQKRIEKLFGQAVNDRSKAYELKKELDRLGLFKDYEDRFLDLFKAAG